MLESQMPSVYKVQETVNTDNSDIMYSYIERGYIEFCSTNKQIIYDFSSGLLRGFREPGAKLKMWGP